MLTHNTSTVAVFQTDQYKNFAMLEGNRGINLQKVNKIIKEIEGGNDMLQYYPIQVKVTGDKMEILDGQHRFFISKKLKRPIFYILVSEDKQMTDIARVNSNVEKWKPSDFIHCYAVKGNQHYITLQNFIEKYKFNVGTSLRLLAFGNPGVEGSNTLLSDQFETGKYEVKKEDEAIEFADQIKLFSEFIYHTDRAFIIALFRIRKAEKITLVELHECFLKEKDMLVKQPSYKNYVTNLEAIVNKGKHKRIVIN